MAQTSADWSDDSSSSDFSDDELHRPCPKSRPFSPSPQEISDILSSLNLSADDFEHLPTRRPSHFTKSAPLLIPSVPQVRETTSAKSQRRGRNRYINQYLLLESLGKGAYGLVRAAKNVTNNEKVAIKIINKSMLKRKRNLRRGKKPTDMLENILREIAIMKKLDHPNIVGLIEVIDDPVSNKLYLVLELVARGSIGVTTAKIEPIHDEEVLRGYFRDMLLGVDYLHTQHIVHSDIKPENLLLGEDGHVKLGDFGVSVILEANASNYSGRIQGTPAFLAPEAIAGGDFDAFKIDIWSMGVTLYTLVTGECPFAGKNLLDTYDRIEEYDPLSPAVDERLKDLLSRMMIKNPAERITLSELMNHPWVTNNGRDPLCQPKSARELIEVNDEEVANAVNLMRMVAEVMSSMKKMRPKISRIVGGGQNQKRQKKRRSLQRFRQVFGTRARQSHRAVAIKPSPSVSSNSKSKSSVILPKVDLEDDESDDESENSSPLPRLRLNESWSEPSSRVGSISSNSSFSTPTSLENGEPSKSASPPSFLKRKLGFFARRNAKSKTSQKMSTKESETPLDDSSSVLRDVEVTTQQILMKPLFPGGPTEL